MLRKNIVEFFFQKQICIIVQYICLLKSLTVIEVSFTFVVDKKRSFQNKHSLNAVGKGCIPFPLPHRLRVDCFRNLWRF